MVTIFSEAALCTVLCLSVCLSCSNTRNFVLLLALDCIAVWNYGTMVVFVLLKGLYC